MIGIRSDWELSPVAATTKSKPHRKRESNRKQISIRFSEFARSDLCDLSSKLGKSNSEIIETALYELASQQLSQ